MTRTYVAFNRERMQAIDHESIQQYDH